MNYELRITNYELSIINCQLSIINFLSKPQQVCHTDSDNGYCACLSETIGSETSFCFSGIDVSALAKQIEKMLELP